MFKDTNNTQDQDEENIKKLLGDFIKKIYLAFQIDFEERKNWTMDFVLKLPSDKCTIPLFGYISLLYLICFAKQIPFDVIKSNQAIIEEDLMKHIRSKIVLSLITNSVPLLLNNEDNKRRDIFISVSKNENIAKISAYVQRFKLIHKCILKLFESIEGN